MPKLTSLKEFITENQKDFNYSTSDLSCLLRDIVLAAKVVNQDIQRAGLLDHVLGAQGVENIQGEAQQKLDVLADQAFIKSFLEGGVVCGIASEENEDFLAFDATSSHAANYVVLFDPLDGSSNIDVNVSVGTIFSIYRRISPVGTKATLEDMLQAGNKQVAAGYVLFGSSTMLVYTTGNGVNGFTLDPISGEFFLSHANMQMPLNGRLYSVNEGNLNDFDPQLRAYLAYCQSDVNQTGKPYSGRYIGSLVADFHRNLIKGGVYIYPAVPSAPKGRLRLLYECNPLAFIAEQAGGLATDGNQRILDIEPTELHQRAALYIGSKEMVEKAMGLV
jgi:fructose-1,6-bisphosphatase I